MENEENVVVAEEVTSEVIEESAPVSEEVVA